MTELREDELEDEDWTKLQWIKTCLRRDMDHRSGFVYVLQMGKGGPVKIGHSNHPEARRVGLQTGSPMELRNCGQIQANSIGEGALHEFLRNFLELHMRGEWYRPSSFLAEILSVVGLPVKFTVSERVDDWWNVADCEGCPLARAARYWNRQEQTGS